MRSNIMKIPIKSRATSRLTANLFLGETRCAQSTLSQVKPNPGSDSDAHQWFAGTLGISSKLTTATDQSSKNMDFHEFQETSQISSTLPKSLVRTFSEEGTKNSQPNTALTFLDHTRDYDKPNSQSLSGHTRTCHYKSKGGLEVLREAQLNTVTDAAFCTASLSGFTAKVDQLLMENFEFIILDENQGAIWRPLAPLFEALITEGQVPSRRKIHALVLTLLRTDNHSIQQAKKVWTAVVALKLLGDRNIPVALKTYHEVLLGCKDLGLHKQSLEVLDTMHSTNVTANVAIYNLALAACGKGGDWKAALLLLDSMRRSGVAPNAKSFTSAMTSCTKAGRWEISLRLLEEMKRWGVAANSFSYSAGIRACDQGGQCERALELLDDMTKQGVVPNEHCFSSALNACSHGGQWERALTLLKEDMVIAGVRPNRVCYGAAMKACGRADRWSDVAGLLESMDDLGVRPDAVNLMLALEACRRLGWRKDASIIFKRLLSVTRVVPSRALEAMLAIYEDGGDWQASLSALRGAERC